MFSRRQFIVGLIGVPTLATRLLMAARGGGGFDVPGYVMSADETTFWQDQAALLDPLAYEFVSGTSQTRTVTGGERWYLMAGWLLQGITSGTSWFHRRADIDNALQLAAGTVIVTDASNAGSYMYLCKPSLVTGSDARYTSDPRALFFDRWMRIGELTTYDLGVTVAAGSHTSALATFATDFTYGLGLHSSQHDVSWVALEHTGADLALAILDEIGDNNPTRFTSRTIFPFTRTQFPKVKILGAGGGVDTGSGNFTYLKLPGDW